MWFYLDVTIRTYNEPFVLSPPTLNKRAHPCVSSAPYGHLATSGAGQELPAVVASLLFTVHPVHVEVRNSGAIYRMQRMLAASSFLAPFSQWMPTYLMIVVFKNSTGASLFCYFAVARDKVAWASFLSKNAHWPTPFPRMPMRSKSSGDFRTAPCKQQILTTRNANLLEPSAETDYWYLLPVLVCECTRLGKTGARRWLLSSEELICSVACSR